MKLSEKQVRCLNEIVEFLAIQDDVPERVDLCILLGSAMVGHLKTVAEMYGEGRFDKLLIVGGIGHSTKYLYENVGKDAVLGKYTYLDKSEAELYKGLLIDIYGFPQEAIEVETESTNCGNNASNALDKVRERGLKCGKVLLIQDPTMQKRSFASFQKAWSNVSVDFYNWCPFVPRLILDSNEDPKFAVYHKIPWQLERYIKLVMGEIPRLKNDENGYGPRGTGFIDAVEIPPSVKEAYDYLLGTLPDSLVERPRKNNG